MSGNNKYFIQATGRRENNEGQTRLFSFYIEVEAVEGQSLKVVNVERVDF